MRRLTRAQARRTAISAQGLAGARPGTAPNLGHVVRAVRRIGYLQLDAVNVVERAHHLTLFSRLGRYDPGLVWRGLEEGKLFEFWARMASLVPIEDYPLFRQRMAAFQDGRGERIADLHARAPGYVESVHRQVEERGPLTVKDLDEPGERTGPWWGWADGKIALEHLFAAGRIAVAHRRNFTRYYDIAERVIPAAVREPTPPTREDSLRSLLGRAAAALGVGTARDIVDYYWIRVAEGKPLLSDLVARGELLEVEVEGWAQPGYLHRDAVVPRTIESRALLNPFDTYMWNRDRVERLHDFFYRIEIYVPRPQRIHGYYVFPFLLGEDLVARVDLKADRRAGVLRANGAFLEPGQQESRVVPELAAELTEMAGWLGLGDVAVGDRGDLAAALRRAF